MYLSPVCDTVVDILGVMLEKILRQPVLVVRVRWRVVIGWASSICPEGRGVLKPTLFLLTFHNTKHRVLTYLTSLCLSPASPGTACLPCLDVQGSQIVGTL